MSDAMMVVPETGWPRPTGRRRTLGRMLADWFRRPGAAMRRARRLIEAGRPVEAFPLLVRAARAEIPDAQYQVGCAYLEGRGVPRCLSEAERWLERAGEHGDAKACSLLAALHIQGVPGLAAAAAGRPGSALLTAATLAKPDYQRAKLWADRAVTGGSAEGLALLAYILTSGPADMRDAEAALDLYRRSAETKCPQGCLGYALALLRQAAAPEDFARVASLLTTAAAAGLPTAQYVLGMMVEQGRGVPANPGAAVELYRRAAEQGLASAQARLGLALMDGRGVLKDPQDGESWLRRAAVQGDPEAAALVGDLYSRGGALPPNYAEAALWYRKAAEAGHKGAARALGLLSLTGALTRDPVEAARWLRVSAEGGDDQSKVDLASLVLKGEASPEDARRSRALFGQQAAAGDLVAAYNYALCLASGVGGERDDAEAARWMRRAAESVVNAQYYYGSFLIEGRGVTANPAEGRAYLARAARSGLPDAQAALAELLVTEQPGDHAGALDLFLRAAAQGHVGAMFGAGAMYNGGYHTPADRPEAQRWFRLAAERGHGRAQLMLGRFLANGTAGDHDPAEARLWLERAEAQGVGKE